MTLASQSPTFAPGSLVHARGRDWVVLPPCEDPDVLLVRPLGGTDDDAAGLFLPLEADDVRPATFAPPDPRYVGDAVSAGLLRDAVRLGFRSAAGPLRSLGRIAVEPRPYQLVPLLMALRQDPVRLLIGDDVGIGKTIEAALIARELLDRGEVRGLAVLCPPHLCEQWQSELQQKFHLDAVVVRPGTVTALERRAEREEGLDLSRTIFEVYPIVVVSIDYIKSDRRRDDFLRTCPKLVIVDEAHGVASAPGRGGGQQQRNELVAALARDPERHLVLCTATPHSGNSLAFASLIGLLDPSIEPAVGAGDFGGGSETRVRLARLFVQRRRADIRRYLAAETDFAERITAEHTYRLSPGYRALLQHVLDYAREVVRESQALGAARAHFQQRIAWWAALALLRCVSSSPAAAAAALRTREPRLNNPNIDARAADRLAAVAVLDLEGSDEAAGDDSTPAGDTVLADDPTAQERARLLRLARDADALKGTGDPKLAEASAIVSGLLKDGFRPIVFCRYLATAHYVADWLAKNLRGATVTAVTGELPPEERELRVAALSEQESPVLVATDCLSEGINLQKAFNAVVHYDLAWNPTRHEQREGRVDRYGQASKQVRTVLLYGQDNRVDGVVLEVLLRKAETIRKTLGISVPVPADSDRVLEAIFDELFQRESTDFRQLDLFVSEQRQQMAAAWDVAAEREQRTRTIFAQHAMRPDEVSRELKESIAAIGGAADVGRFVDNCLVRLGAAPVRKGSGEAATLQVNLKRLPEAVQTRLSGASSALANTVTLGFQPAVSAGVQYVPRTHPLVETLGSFVLDLALDRPAEAVLVAGRCGAMRTDAVRERTILALLRARSIISQTSGAGVQEMLAEEALLAAFTGEYANPIWLPADEAERLADEVRPAANVPPGQATAWVQQALAALPGLQPSLEHLAQDRARTLLEAHRRVRAVGTQRGVRFRVDAKLPLDLVGLYVLMPAAPVARAVR